MTRSLHRNKDSDLKGHLKKQALQSVRKNGVRSVSIRSLTSALGVTPMAAYRHFESKEALLAEITADGLREFAKHLQKHGKGEDLEERLINVCASYVEFAYSQRHYFELIFGSHIKDRRKYPNLYSAGGEAFEVLIGLVKDCQQAGVLDRKMKAMDCAVNLWVHIHGLSTLMSHWKTSDRVVLDRNVRTTTAAFMRTLLKGLGETR